MSEWMINGLSTVDVELKQRFDELIGERSYLEHRWEDYAGWTLPYLFPHEEYYSTTEMQHDYQSLGAQCANHLANKIVMTLFPPARPFFKVELTPEQDAEIQEQGFTPGDIDVFTSRAEKQAMRNAEKIKLRTTAINAMKNLIALGNTLVYYPEEVGKPSQVYALRDYVVKRDLSGLMTQTITRDRKDVSTVPLEYQDALEAKGYKPEDKVDLYTGITRQANGSYFVKQELCDVVITTDGVYPEKDLPWNALAWNLVRGQDYANGLVEDFAGDFHVLSSMAESNVNTIAIASDIKILVNPMGQTDVDTLNNSESGTYVAGIPTDVAYLQMEKMAELQYVTGFIDKYERRISSAFLLNTQVTRDAERVTAEEIRMNANELEASLGGVYSRLAEDMQLPLARLLLKSVNKELADMEPVILTGVESLSRNSEHEQMMLFLQDLGVMANIPEPMIPNLKWDDIAKILASNRGLEYSKMIKTTEEKEKEQQEAQAAEAEQQAQMSAADSMGQEMGPGMAQGMGQQIGVQPI
jgi:hypothetical protein